MEENNQEIPYSFGGKVVLGFVELAEGRRFLNGKTNSLGRFEASGIINSMVKELHIAWLIDLLMKNNDTNVMWKWVESQS